MANWNDMGQGSNWGADMLQFNFGPTAPTGAGNSYAGQSAIPQPGRVPMALGNVNVPYSPQELNGPNLPYPSSGGGGGGMTPASWSEGLPWASGPSGGGGRMSVGGGGGGVEWMNLPVHSQILDRLRNVITNPGAVQNDPEYQFLRSEGERSLARSAGARRMRFSGKSMLDFLNYGQRAANQYLGDITNRYATGAQTELPYLMHNQRAEAIRRNQQIMQADPYGRARQIYSQYASPDAYARQWGGYSNSAKDNRVYTDQWNLGKRLSEQAYAPYSG